MLSQTRNRVIVAFGNTLKQIRGEREERAEGARFEFDRWREEEGFKANLISPVSFGGVCFVMERKGRLNMC